MSPERRLVFETERLIVRIATEDDVALFHALWTNPQVMTYVGFPQGIPLTLKGMKARPLKISESPFDCHLVVELKETGRAIGESKLASPDEEGIAGPDLKLLPEFWGHKYGQEAWRARVDYEFTHTDCAVVLGTPNVENIASIKTQEAAGAVRTGEDLYEFPESMQAYTTPVHCYIYKITRANWEGRRAT
ncbi:MAG: GNAT family N-acetyltransferase [Anaerolineae bacterium]|nr:GNAT family N-acetyltransferase [Anaerolineae bacterium]